MDTLLKRVAFVRKQRALRNATLLGNQLLRRKRRQLLIVCFEVPLSALTLCPNSIVLHAYLGGSSIALEVAAYLGGTLDVVAWPCACIPCTRLPGTT